MVSLHEYQQQGVAHLRGRDRALLFYEMGLGKTATALSALEDKHLPVLVVAPLAIARESWEPEVDTFRPDLTVAVAVGDKRKRKAALDADADITVLTVSAIDDLAEYAKNPRWRTLIVDEVSGFKATNTKKFRILARLTKDGGVTYAWGLTGTPATEDLMGLWGQLRVVGLTPFGTLTDYRSTYFTPGATYNNVVTKWEPRPGAREKILAVLEPIALSASQAEYNPEVKKRFAREQVTMPEKTKQAYNDMLREMVAELDGKVLTVDTAAAKASKLAQIASGFSYREDPDTFEREVIDLDTAKLDRIEHVLSDGRRTLVFYAFTEEKKRLLSLPGAVDIKEPGAISRWNAGEIKILVAHPLSAGHGLNLQHGGDRIIWATLPWSLEQFLQANARLARQGQRNIVDVVILQAAPIDQQKLKALQGKISLQDAVMDALKLSASTQE